jgi:hypothetical protein
MISPTVTELPRRLEPVSRDTFMDGTWRPAPRRPRPLAPRGVVVQLRPGIALVSPAARAA